MKTCKTILCLFLALAMPLASLTGCDARNNERTNTSSDTPSDNPGAATGEGTDVSNDAAYSYSEGIDENGFWTGIRALDFVEKFNYLGISIPSDVHQITDDAIQSEIDNIVDYYASGEQITDRAIEDGDTVNIDYVGSVDGVEFEGGSSDGQGADVTAGSAEFIDDFLTQIIGHMPGETFDVNVTFPDVYEQNEDLQGKDAVFVTTINYIVGNSEATDEFVAANLSADYGWTTVAQMREDIRSGLQKNAFQQYINQYFSTEVAVKSVPDQLVAYQERAMVNYYQEDAANYGEELEEYLSYEGFASLDEAIEANRDSNVANATFYLIVQAVAEDADLSVSDEDMAYYLGTSDYSTYVEEYGLPYLKQYALIQKVIDQIVDNAVLE